MHFGMGSRRIAHKGQRSMGRVILQITFMYHRTRSEEITVPQWQHM